MAHFAPNNTPFHEQISKKILKVIYSIGTFLQTLIDGFTLFELGLTQLFLNHGLVGRVMKIADRGLNYLGAITTYTIILIFYYLDLVMI